MLITKGEKEQEEGEKKNENYRKREPLIIIKVEPSCLDVTANHSTEILFYVVLCSATERAGGRKRIFLRFLCLNNSKNKNLTKAIFSC